MKVLKLTIKTTSQDLIKVLGSDLFTECYFERGVKRIKNNKNFKIKKEEEPNFKEKMFFARKVEINIDNHFNEEEVKWAKLMLED